MKVERREFLLLRAGQPAVLSCEPLFMRFVDSQMDGTTAQLFDRLDADLRQVSTVRLTETSWLAREDLKRPLDRVLHAFVSRGGRIA